MACMSFGSPTEILRASGDAEHGCMQVCPDATVRHDFVIRASTPSEPFRKSGGLPTAGE